MTPATATVAVHIADAEEIKIVLAAIAALVEALKEELAEPFTMTPETQARLREQVAGFETAIAVLR